MVSHVCVRQTHTHTYTDTYEPEATGACKYASAHACTLACAHLRHAEKLIAVVILHVHKVENVFHAGLRGLLG